MQPGLKASTAADTVEAVKNPALVSGPEVRGASEISEHINSYRTQIEELAKSFYENPNNVVQGESGEVGFERTFRSGKQQPVAGFKLAFPDGFEAEIVIRPSYKDNAFVSNYAESQTLKENFPEVYLQLQGKNDYELLVVEKLNGFHEHQSPERFAALIENEAGLNQLVTDSFKAVDQVLTEGFGLSDICPINGHNLMFDPEKEVFRLFDVDTVKQNADSHAFKFQSFLGKLNPDRDASVDYSMKMIALYDKNYPDTLLETSSARDRNSYALVRDLNQLATIPDGYKVITPADGRKWDNARVSYFHGSLPDLPKESAFLVRQVEEVYRMDPELLTACRENDREGFVAALRRLKGETGVTELQRK